MKKSMFMAVAPRWFVLSLRLVLVIIPACAEAQVNYELVSVADTGNKNDASSFGGVNYVYQIGKYEVTIGQYAAFLNAVAKESDPYSLWNKSMKVANIQGIERSGSSGNYTYSVLAASSSNLTSKDMPITGVSWFNAARFANWMANGQPTGPENSSTTENGAYNLNGATSGKAQLKNSLNPNTGNPPLFYIPLENEWYKAAFYNGAGAYYLYATQSNSLPSNVIGSGSSNQANYLADFAKGYCVSQSLLFDSNQTYLTNVGLFVNSPSHYGTFDQNGSVWEWNDLDGGTSYSRGLKGGGWTSTSPYIQSSYRLITVASSFSVNVGFRLASPQ